MREVGQQKLIFLGHEMLSCTDLIRTELKPNQVQSEEMEARKAKQEQGPYADGMISA